MQLVEIDPIRFQATEARFDGRKDISAGRSLECFGLVHGKTELRGENDIFAPLAENLAHDCFRATALAVNIGGIEKIDTKVDRFVDDFARHLQVNKGAEIIAPQSDK